MTITEFKKTLSDHPQKWMRFVLPNGESIPSNYHITEVGRVQKDFIDCGGTVRSDSSCILQIWIAANDEDHRLEAGKLSVIMDMAGKLLADNDLPIEVEYEAPLISQFSVISAEVTVPAIVFHLKSKHTDCLAKESCGLEGSSCSSSGETSCCG